VVCGVLTWCSFVDVTNITEECAVFGVMTLCGLVSVAIITEEHAVTVFTTELWFMMKQFNHNSLVAYSTYKSDRVVKYLKSQNLYIFEFNTSVV